MALTAFCDTGFFRVRLMKELEGLMPLHVERARKRNPTGQQRDRKPKSEDNRGPCRSHSSTVQPFVEKKCWSKHTRCCRDNN